MPFAGAAPEAVATLSAWVTRYLMLAVLGGPVEAARLVRRAVAVLGRGVPYVLARPPPGYPGPP